MYKISSNCDGCGKCLESCPVEGAIIPVACSQATAPYQIVQELCAECGACQEECEQRARAIVEL